MTRLADIGGLRALVATPRRRRVGFLAAASPGVLTLTLGPLASPNPAWPGLGLVFLVLVLAARRLSEPRFVALEAGACEAGEHGAVP